MRWRKKIAAWIDPEGHEDALDNQVEIGELRSELAAVGTELGDVCDKLATCAANNLNTKAVNVELRKALNGAIAYVIDAVDDLQEQLDSLGPKSRKRVALEATLGAVKYDLDRFRKVAIIVTPEGGK